MAGGVRSRSSTPCRRPGDVTLQRPIVICVSSVAIGWRWTNTQCERPRNVSGPIGIPLAATVAPAGASIRNVNVALSRGWSLLG